MRFTPVEFDKLHDEVAHLISKPRDFYAQLGEDRPEGHCRLNTRNRLFMFLVKCASPKLRFKVCAFGSFLELTSVIDGSLIPQDMELMCNMSASTMCRDFYHIAAALSTHGATPHTEGWCVIASSATAATQSAY